MLLSFQLLSPKIHLLTSLCLMLFVTQFILKWPHSLPTMKHDLTFLWVFKTWTVLLLYIVACNLWCMSLWTSQELLAHLYMCLLAAAACDLTNVCWFGIQWEVTYWNMFGLENVWITNLWISETMLLRWQSCYHYLWISLFCSDSDTVFLWSDTATTILFAVCFTVATTQRWLLFEGDIYFLLKPADSNDSWIKYMWAIQLGLIDAGSTMCSISVSCGNES